MLAATLPDNGGYVAAAYLVLTALLLLYLVIMATRLKRLERELHALEQRAGRARDDAARTGGGAHPTDPRERADG